MRCLPGVRCILIYLKQPFCVLDHGPSSREWTGTRADDITWRIVARGNQSGIAGTTDCLEPNQVSILGDFLESSGDEPVVCSLEL